MNPLYSTHFETVNSLYSTHFETVINQRLRVERILGAQCTVLFVPAPVENTANPRVHQRHGAPGLAIIVTYMCTPARLSATDPHMYQTQGERSSHIHDAGLMSYVQVEISAEILLGEPGRRVLACMCRWR